MKSADTVQQLSPHHCVERHDTSEATVDQSCRVYEDAGVMDAFPSPSALLNAVAPSIAPSDGCAAYAAQPSTCAIGSPGASPGSQLTSTSRRVSARSSDAHFHPVGRRQCSIGETQGPVEAGVAAPSLSLPPVPPVCAVAKVPMAETAGGPIFTAVPSPMVAAEAAGSALSDCVGSTPTPTAGLSSAAPPLPDHHDHPPHQPPKEAAAPKVSRFARIAGESRAERALSAAKEASPPLPKAGGADCPGKRGAPAELASAVVPAAPAAAPATAPASVARVSAAAIFTEAPVPASHEPAAAPSPALAGELFSAIVREPHQPPKEIANSLEAAPAADSIAAGARSRVSAAPAPAAPTLPRIRGATPHADLPRCALGGALPVAGGVFWTADV
jgi:hypothetical protein